MSDDNVKSIKPNQSVSNREFQQQLESTAKISRSEETNEATVKARDMLYDVAELLKPHKDLKYLGSVAVHIYSSEVANQLMFASQTGTLGNCPEAIAQAAFKDLVGSAMEHYSRRRMTKRSGF